MEELSNGEFKALKFLVKQGGEYLEQNEKHLKYAPTLLEKEYVVRQSRKIKNGVIQDVGISEGEETLWTTIIHTRGEQRFYEEVRRRRIRIGVPVATLILVTFTLIASIIIPILTN